ncbi:MAG: SUMF1/EgtB/PvdO family nonheme iron enzyme [Pirellulaceae bacterium]|nr:SUMF1/EgtB/PvdO family nonheme iron enzyme [Pirellulaceae bacterium]
MNASGRVELLEQRNPALIRLACMVSPAARVDPALLRSVRLSLMPATRAGIEGDLWFSPLVQAANPGGFQFYPDVANLLRTRLAADPEVFERTSRLIADVHQHQPPLLRLEEEIIRLTFPRREDRLAEIDKRLLPLVAALQQPNRKGIARWVTGVATRLPTRVQTPTLARLQLLAKAQILGVDFVHGEGQQLTEDEFRDVLTVVGQVNVGVRLREDRLELFEPPVEGSQIISVPAARSRSVELAWRDDSRQELVWPPNEAVSVPVGPLPATIRTLSGGGSLIRSRRSATEQWNERVRSYFVMITDESGEHTVPGFLADEHHVVTADGFRLDAERDETSSLGFLVKFPLLDHLEAIPARVVPDDAETRHSGSERHKAGGIVFLRLQRPIPVGASRARGARNEVRDGDGVVGVGVIPEVAEARWEWFRVRGAASKGSVEIHPAANLRTELLISWSGSPLLDVHTGKLLGICRREPKDLGAALQLVPVSVVKRGLAAITSKGRQSAPRTRLGGRGYLLQALIALCDLLDDHNLWTSVALEPNIASDKVDLLWRYRDGIRAVQVKSSQNSIRSADIERWAAELQSWRSADRYTLVLVGPYESAAAAKIRRVGQVDVPAAVNLDLQAFLEQAAHRLDSFLAKHGLRRGDAGYREMLAAAIAERLARFSTQGRVLERASLVELLKAWIEETDQAGRPGTAGSRTLTLLRVLVSAPEEVAEQRKVLEDVIASLNRIECQGLGVRLELVPWSKNSAPQIGPQEPPPGEASFPPCDAFVGILATRFDPPAVGRGRRSRPASATERDFQAALRAGRQAGPPWIRFYFDEQPKLSGDPEQAEQFVQVCKFRRSLDEPLVAAYSGVRGSNDSFYDQVFEHLRTLVQRLAPVRAETDRPAAVADPVKYLQDLRDKTEYIDIRGLHVGKGRAHRLNIEDLYISLTTTDTAPRDSDDEPQGRGGGRKWRKAEAGRRGLDSVQRRTVPLHQILSHDRLVVVGDPGSGKTTFLRRIAHTLCQTELGDIASAAQDRLGVNDRTFPIFLRVSEWAAHLVRHGDETSAPAGEHAPAWLPHCLAASHTDRAGLSAAFFQQRLEEGRCTVLLDGMDEAPDRLLRERLARLIENAAAAYRGCSFVVTCRPAAYVAETVLPSFVHARIDPLSDEALETFLRRWCEEVYGESRQAAQDHFQELRAAVRTRPEIRRMARNPVMLTALAVVHWNERRLPEQRADLYQSIITWLSRAREQRKGRKSAERTVLLLQELALAMQDDPSGRQIQVSKRWAADKLARELGDGRDIRQTVQQAEQFLDQEELDSGIIVTRGSYVTFWHLTFQEFLASRAIAARLETEQQQILFADPAKLYRPDWREVVLLLAGTLHQQGNDKVGGFLGRLLDSLGPAPDLAALARCAGLVGGILRDLAPLSYQFADPRYPALLDAVTAIFDPARNSSVPIENRMAAADALGQAGDPRLDWRRSDYWATIPAGKFLMGAQRKDSKQPNYDEEAFDDGEWRETPHEVSLDAYRIARYPVTVGQYREFIQDDGYQDARWWTAGGFGQFTEPQDWEQQQEFPSRPVVGVSWSEAAAFCQWVGCRLPTEAEWEHAARGTTGRKFPWGDEPADEQRMNFAGKVGHPTPVGIYPLGNTLHGISDLAGNVCEWCADWFEEYHEGSVANPRGPDSGTHRVIRGGCWDFDASRCRAAFRLWVEPGSRVFIVGFRVAAGPSSR